VALTLYLVRHGATEWTRSGQHTSITDLPLLPEGEEQGRLAARLLDGIDFVAVYSSDRRRCIQTAEVFGFQSPVVTPLLREFDYGEYEGLTTAEIQRTRPGWEIFRDGCPGGETPEQVYVRAGAFLRLLDGLQGKVLAFSHGHFSRVLAAAWTGLTIELGTHLSLDTASICSLHDGDRGRLIERWNLTST
jgi:broad specificity phosphatase PhoE